MGVVPYPKLDETQKQHYSYVEDQVSVFAIVKHAPNTDIIGAVLEAMSSYSFRKVMPTYYTTILKGRYVRDPESAAVLDEMIQNIRVDTAWCYNSSLKNLGSTMRTLVESQYPWFASTYQGNKSVFEDAVRKLIPEEESTGE